MQGKFKLQLYRREKETRLSRKEPLSTTFEVFDNVGQSLLASTRLSQRECNHWNMGRNLGALQMSRECKGYSSVIGINRPDIA
ncbi:hypothetical protein GUITHDRAFT_114752 [Guillardia theta CCMP2712]|uniref:Uncharacterized protein n=1 Tax=Guillardia theta (strain CCMP2712) TaxID=905079 RepID=L1IT65_GUITC|nr:hypothetical protein GUITHDRAFT_114752 [Guillardia theta CCMP2712]EKX39094.1 hypothetical protein GUITHDRAFT_114752 [Guillardia theta CCMP2712]|eukprot:XP_005826074.1 hypothetical protein GUITHDRAFT_114752 [Guillardia theta CCMP2712]